LEKLQLKKYRLKPLTNDLVQNAKIPMQKQKKYVNKKKGNMIPPEVNNCTIIDSNDSEVMKFQEKNIQKNNHRDDQ
jgi:hypothetical protein